MTHLKVNNPRYNAEVICGASIRSVVKMSESELKTGLILKPKHGPSPKKQARFRAASHRTWLRPAIRLMAKGSLHTGSVSRVRVKFFGFDRLPAYLSQPDCRDCR